MMDTYLRRLSLIISRYASLYLRIALAAAFLTSVTDRFGIWGPPGTMNVAWGDMTHFMAYAAKLNPWFPIRVIPVVAWFVTVAETVLALALLLGFHTRMSAQLSGGLLLAFGIGMTAGTGIESALNASVFSASAGAFLLATSAQYPFSFDSLGRREKRDVALNACIRSQAKNTCLTSLVPHPRHWGEVQ
jgi:thiosulfate dehydrogenase [quinone] large subunit